MIDKSQVEADVYYLYHSREKSSLDQTQEWIYNLKHGHHLTEIHHVCCGVEGIVEGICRGKHTHTTLHQIQQPHYLQNKCLLSRRVSIRQTKAHLLKAEFACAVFAIKCSSAFSY